MIQGLAQVIGNPAEVGQKEVALVGVAFGIFIVTLARILDRFVSRA